MIDENSGWMCDAPMPSKRAHDLIEAIGDSAAFLNKNSHKVDELCTDYENRLGTLQSFLSERAIDLRQSLPGKHQVTIERLTHTYLCTLHYIPPEKIERESLSHSKMLTDDHKDCKRKSKARDIS
jgi:hypothetical protein